MADDLARYGPFILAMASVSILIARYPDFSRVPKERVRSTLLIYNAALVVFVALDLVSGRALTSPTDLAKAASLLTVAVLGFGIANVIYLIVRRRAPR